MAQIELKEIKKNHTGHGIIIDNDGDISLNEGKNKQLKESFESTVDWHCPYPFKVNAVFQKAGIKNANGRVYPREVLERQVEAYQQKIAERRALGECNHPVESTIDLGRISHNITELHWEGNTVVGEMELNLTHGFVKHGICSSLGDTVANLLLNGYKIGVSSRGVGSVEQKLGVYTVGDDFELICWDVVSDPSTPNAWIGDPQELQQYIESNESHKTKVGLNEKINKLNNILNS